MGKVMPSEQELLEIIDIQTEIAKLGRNLGDVMKRVTERTLSLVRADGVAIELAEGDDMVYRATAGMANGHLGIRLKRDASLSGLCTQTGQILRCDDAETDPRADREACRKVGIRSMIVMPLQHNESTVGVLKAMAAAPAHFTDHDVELLKLLSSLVAAAMYHATHDDNSDLVYKATHDDLTGLANRSLFMDRLRSSLIHLPQQSRGVGVLMIDMDGLKEINDTCGHRAGDAVIREFATRTKSCARSSDTVARLGGDEFAIILNPVDLPDGVGAAIKRIQSALEAPFLFEDRSYQLYASIGAARFPDDGHAIDTLLELADQRMYAIKRQRKGQQGSRLH
ncbi:sensor domain-containing diguanylate cyclase [Parazoarcus communis]|nr:sensor domain-containing diguanylate cyclase [Parazoarcus communis]